MLKLILCFFLFLRLASACSHVAALLFKCQSAVLLGLNNVACTSKECEWNKSRKQADPLPLSQIQFKRPKKEEQIPSILADKEYTTKGFSNLDPAKKDSLELKEKLKKLLS